jgi:hypothetical protein
VATITTEEYGGSTTEYEHFFDPRPNGPTSDAVYLRSSHNARLRRRNIGSGPYLQITKIATGDAIGVLQEGPSVALETNTTYSFRCDNGNNVGGFGVVPFLYRPVSATSTTGQVTISPNFDDEPLTDHVLTFTTSSTAPVNPALVFLMGSDFTTSDNINIDEAGLRKGTIAIGDFTVWDGDTPDTLEDEYSWTGQRWNSASKKVSAAPGLITPLLVRNYGYNFQSRNIIHETLDTQTTYVTLRRPTARAGTLDLLMSSRMEAMRAEATLRSAFKFHFEAPETGEDYWFALSGGITVDWSEVQDYWIVTIDWREVSAPA